MCLLVAGTSVPDLVSACWWAGLVHDMAGCGVFGVPSWYLHAGVWGQILR